MRHRLHGSLTAALIALGLLLAPAAASADAGAVTVLAAEEGGEHHGEPAGPEPMPADATENPAAPAEYESNFLWGAGVGLLAMTLFAVFAVGGLYYLLVWRPGQEQRSGTR